MERIKLLNQPLAPVVLVRPAQPPAKVTVQYVPQEDKYVRMFQENKLYWKPF